MVGTIFTLRSEVRKGGKRRRMSSRLGSSVEQNASSVGRRAACVIVAVVGLGLMGSVSAKEARSVITIDAAKVGPTIDKNVYGQFVEHLGRGVYEGIWVGPNSKISNVRGIRIDVVEALRKIKVPVIRWPGGCFADGYHWRDGIGSFQSRPPGINAAWDRSPETNEFGTHEFMDFLEQIGADPFISVNVGSGSVREADDWMRYMTADPVTAPGRERAANGRQKPWNIPFVGVGNESWGCGGNMSADTYAEELRRYANYLRNYTGEPAKLIAVGADTDDFAWTDRVMALAMRWRPNPTPLSYKVDRPLFWGMSLHFYTFAGNDWFAKGRNLDFDEGGWAKALARARMVDALIDQHARIMDKYDPEKRVAIAVDEWGGWFQSEKNAPSQLYLESTLRDALIAGISLSVFNRHADRVRMANVAQMVNVIQSLILTKGDRMVVTPTYHVFDMYKDHQGATSLPAEVETQDYTYGEVKLPKIDVSASKGADGHVRLTIVNLDPDNSNDVTIRLAGQRWSNAKAKTLTAQKISTRVSFDERDVFVPRNIPTFVGSGTARVPVPSKSVTIVELF